LATGGILRTKDAYDGAVTNPEIEDLLRETLVKIAKDALGIDVSAEAASQPNRAIIDLLTTASGDFSKYKLAKAYLRWSRDNSASDLASTERDQFKVLIEKINKALK
jgi:hypothetical protein